MEKNSPYFLYMFFLAFSVLLAEAASRFADCLYRRNAALLSEPPTKAPRLRRPLLALGFFACGFLLLSSITSYGPETVAAAKMSLPLSVAGAFLLFVITVTDAERQMIFDDTTLPLALLGLARSALWSFAASGYGPLLEHIAAALVGGAAFLLLAVLTRGGVGGGDVKLIAALGLWLGPARLTSVAFIGLALGGLAALLLLLTKRKKRRETFAYGPYFAVPAVVFLLTKIF